MQVGELVGISSLIEPLFKGRRKQGCQRLWRTLNGWTKSTYSGQRLESHTKTLMERVSLGINYIPLPTIGEGLGEWFEAPSYEEGVGVDGVSEGVPSDGVWGYPPARDMSRCVSLPMVSPSAKQRFAVCVKSLGLIEECKASLQKNS